jgi:hypothetical protein
MQDKAVLVFYQLSQFATDPLWCEKAIGSWTLSLSAQRWLDLRAAQDPGHVRCWLNFFWRKRSEKKQYLFAPSAVRVSESGRAIRSSKIAIGSWSLSLSAHRMLHGTGCPLLVRIFFSGGKRTGKGIAFGCSISCHSKRQTHCVRERSTLSTRPHSLSAGTMKVRAGRDSTHVHKWSNLFECVCVCVRACVRACVCVCVCFGGKRCEKGQHLFAPSAVTVSDRPIVWESDPRSILSKRPHSLRAC